jgi:hypothetical protein
MQVEILTSKSAAVTVSFSPSATKRRLAIIGWVGLLLTAGMTRRMAETRFSEVTTSFMLAFSRLCDRDGHSVVEFLAGWSDFCYSDFISLNFYYQYGGEKTCHNFGKLL